MKAVLLTRASKLVDSLASAAGVDAGLIYKYGKVLREFVKNG